ncbi:hypothetical protein ACN9ML_29830 [Dyadobacter endophyticus]|uniref:hypothetical protein n=1 Tax=Dyadobacter endophyticus TaxID=1749036 RepID=UPI003CF21CCD
MEQVKPTLAPDTAEAANVENRKPALTMEILIERMMQTYRDLQAYHRGEISLEELQELGIKLG